MQALKWKPMLRFFSLGLLWKTPLRNISTEISLNFKSAFFKAPVTGSFYKILRLLFSVIRNTFSILNVFYIGVVV